MPAAPRRVAVVSTFPPRRDGIAAYADQYAASLGRDALRIGDSGSAADVATPFGRMRTPLQILSAAAPKTDLHVMWHSMFHLPGRRPARAATYLLWRFLAARRRLHVVVHEPEPSLKGIQGWAQRCFWRGASSVLFHSTAERDVFLRTVGIPVSDRLQIIEHHAAFRRATGASHDEARRRLGIDAPARVALCIGFLGAHKGFDRAITAFAASRLSAPAALYLVGSVLEASPELSAHVESLRLQTATHDRVTLVERYVTDEEFDLWLLASDVVVLPYRSISSSGVAARARILDCRVIATKAGALGEQLAGDAILVDTDAELADALRAVLA